jgi:recombination protein RecR
MCVDQARERNRLLVVEHPKDLVAFESTGYRGLYHVLHGRLSSLEGTQENDITLEELIRRVKGGAFREVILATNPDLEGDGTALTIHERIKGCGAKVTRLARGVPTGGLIEYANAAVLTDALYGRTEMDRRQMEDV